jgi:hypothetical protein
MWRTRFWCLLFILGAAPLQAESQTTGPPKATMEELLERIQKLEQKVDQLQEQLQARQGARSSPSSPVANSPSGEVAHVRGPAAAEAASRPVPALDGKQESSETKQASAPPPTPPAADPPPVKAQDNQAINAAQTHEHVTPTTVEGAPEAVHYPSLGIRGFTNINFSAQNEKGSTSGFTMGQFVLHLSGALSEKVSYFGELSFTATPEGYNADVERSLIRYDYNDHLKVSFGRYHTPINYWNTAFHHGLWLQTTVDRPEMIKFGSKLIPVHFTGALVEGTVPGTGSLNLNYNVGLGNGRGSIISRPGDAGDINSNRAWLVNLYARPDWAYGLQVGGSVYRDKLSVIPSSLNVREWIESAHLVYTKGRPELLAEFANIHHDRVGLPGAFNSQAWYVQVAYRLPWFEQNWKPYYRFEYTHVPTTDPVFSLAADRVPSFNASVLGVRYDISRFAAIKAEYRNSRLTPGEPRVDGAFLQTAFTF